MGRTLLLFLLLAAVGQGKPAEDHGFGSEIQEVANVSATAYWSTNCGDRTFVGSSILKMEWTECKDYCKYFPHAKEVGHTFQVADDLDDKMMECLRDRIDGSLIDPNDGNTGCLRKSEQTVAEKELEESDCPSGWFDLDTVCVHISPDSTI